MPTPLPLNPFDEKSQPQWHHAFARCTWLESLQGWGLTRSELPEAIMLQTSPRVAGRTLGFALIYAPSEASRTCVAREINACDDDQEVLAGLAHLYIYGLIRIFRNPKGPTPAMSRDLSPRESFGRATDMHAEGGRQAAGKTPRWLRDQVMRREGHRCSFTGKVDWEAEEQMLITDGDGAILEVAHIMSQSLTEDIGGLSDAAKDKLQWASSAAAILDRFAGIEIRELLKDLDVHQPINAMMASHDPHALFDRLIIWLTPAEDAQGAVLENTYDLKCSKERFRRGFGLHSRVQFKHYMTVDGVDVPPPSRRLLELHAACAQIAHISGAAEVLDVFDGEPDANEGLSLGHLDMTPNPTGAAELVRALNRVVIGSA